MPLFDFTCEKCSKLFEELVSHDEMPKCPECGSKKVMKELPLFAAQCDSDTGFCETRGVP